MRIYLRQNERQLERSKWHDFLCVTPRVVGGHLVVFEVVERREVSGLLGCFWKYRLK
jgi:hypothetical protein